MLSEASDIYNDLLSDYDFQYTNLLDEKKIKKYSKHNSSDL